MNEEYKSFLNDFQNYNCKVMLYWFLVYNKADCYPFIKVLGKAKQLHYKYSIFTLKDNFNMTGVLMNYVFIKIVELNMSEFKLVSPGYVCKCNKI